MSIPRDKWPKWAECDNCRLHWNLHGFMWGYATRRAADFYRRFHKESCSAAVPSREPGGEA